MLEKKEQHTNTKELFFSHFPDRNILEAGFNGAEGLTQVFCMKCGKYYEIPFKTAEGIAMKAKIEISSEDLGKFFFAIPCCSKCEAQAGRATLIKISDLPQASEFSQKALL